MRGFTLPEVLIATLLATFVAGLLLSILVNNSGLFYQQSSRISQGLGINDALPKIRTSIKESKAVAVSYPETPPATYTTSAVQLVLKLATIDLSDNIIANTFDYIVFIKEQDKLKFKQFPNMQSKRKAEDRILAADVSNILFEYFDVNGVAVSPSQAVKVKVTITLQTKTGKTVEVNIATSEANLRND